MKIHVFLPMYVAKARAAVEKSEVRFNNNMIFSEVTYESNMPYALRYMIDRDINGMQWIQIPKGMYTVRPS